MDNCLREGRPHAHLCQPYPIRKGAPTCARVPSRPPRPRTPASLAAPPLPRTERGPGGEDPKRRSTAVAPAPGASWCMPGRLLPAPQSANLAHSGTPSPAANRKPGAIRAPSLAPTRNLVPTGVCFAGCPPRTSAATVQRWPLARSPRLTTWRKLVYARQTAPRRAHHVARRHRRGPRDTMCHPDACHRLARTAVTHPNTAAKSRTTWQGADT
jgi:hypothetical protein